MGFPAFLASRGTVKNTWDVLISYGFIEIRPPKSKHARLCILCTHLQEFTLLGATVHVLDHGHDKLRLEFEDHSVSVFNCFGSAFFCVCGSSLGQVSKTLPPKTFISWKSSSCVNAVKQSVISWYCASEGSQQNKTLPTQLFKHPCKESYNMLQPKKSISLSTTSKNLRVCSSAQQEFPPKKGGPS